MNHHFRSLFPPAFCGIAVLLLLNPLGARADAGDSDQASPPATAPWDWTALDWKLRDQLTPAQREALPVACCGAFIQPELSAKQTATAKSKEDEAITISGQSSQITKQSTVMRGDVLLTQGDRMISGDYAELYNQPQGVQLQGNVLFREPGFLLQGSSAKIELEHNTLEIKNARFVLHDVPAHGEAGSIQRDADGVITLTDTTYSSCTPGDELWFLKSSSMTLDPAKGQGRAKHARFEIFDTPVFYVPYLIFPIGNQRHSGFLAPSFSINSDGSDIAIPYYLNLAPNYDATVIPRIISSHGSQIGGEFRHLSPLFTSSVAGTWLADDKERDIDRWLLSLKQHGGAQQPWSTVIDITRVSDNDYFDDLDNSGLSVTRSTNLQQMGSAGYMTDHWDMRVEVQEFQTLRDSVLTDPYNQLPEVFAGGSYYLGHGFSTKLSQSVSRFEHRDENQVTGDRLQGDYRLEWRSNWQAGFIEPAVEFHYLEQNLTNARGDDHPSVAIPAATVDAGLVFVHDDAHYQQTLEPRIFYNYTEYKNQNDFQLFDTNEMTFGYAQLFRDYRFSGPDRIGDADQTSLGLTSRWINKTTGAEQLQLGVGKIFFNEDRRVIAYDPAIFALLPQSIQNEYSNDQSPLVGSLLWSINSQWRLNSELIWNQEDSKTHSANIFAHYRTSNDTLFSIGHRYVKLLEWTGTNYIEEAARQGDISFYTPVTDQWALVGRTFFDFSNSRNLESLAGFQYEDCCWKLRTVYRYWSTNPDDVYDIRQHDSEKGIYIEFQFKNLAGVGTKTNNMLKDSVYGYDKND